MLQGAVDGSPLNFQFPRLLDRVVPSTWPSAAFSIVTVVRGGAVPRASSESSSHRADEIVRRDADLSSS
jgi:hypothetical protein